jgi:MFS-type transporter involved in bile tolerance (Atg22 family)
MRERKMFTIFTLFYTILIFSTSFFIDIVTRTNAGFGDLAVFFLIISFGFAIFLSVLYAFLIVIRNRRTWATLKCIGWTNGNINSLITGIVMYTTLIGFVIVIEILLHYAALIAYLQTVNYLMNLPSVLISLLPVVISFGIFLFVQLIAIIVANRKVLNIRPMLALKRPGE